MKASVKIGLLAGCLVMVAYSASAYSITRQPDGNVYIRGCQSKTIGNTDYLCCDDNCQTRDYWVKRAYSNNEVNYMADMEEVEVVDRYSLTNINSQTIQSEDMTPALGKFQNKLNKLGSEVFGLIGL